MAALLLVGMNVESNAQVPPQKSRQFKIGYASNLGPAGAVYASAGAGCMVWPPYSEVNPGGHYVFIEATGSDETGYTCKTELRDRATDTEPPISYNGAVEPLYKYKCTAPFSNLLKDGPDCVFEPPKDNGNQCPVTPSTPNPINIATGNKFMSLVLYRHSGEFPLELLLSYNSTAIDDSVAQAPGGLVQQKSTANIYTSRDHGVEVIPENYSYQGATAPGVGWQSNMQAGVVELPSDKILTLLRADGRVYAFRLVNGTWVSDADVNGKMQKIFDASGNAAGWEYTNPRDEVEKYSTAGKLVSVTNRNGLTHTYYYDAFGRVSMLQHSFGQIMSFGYDGKNRLQVIWDPANKQYFLGYDAKGNLSSITYPGGKSVTYLYEDPNFPNAMTGVIDENGQRYMSYHYDSKGRATAEEHSGNIGHVQLNFAQNSTTTVDAFGTERQMIFSKLLGVDRMTSQSQPGGAGCGPSGSQRSHDANGNIATITDFNGVTTSYDYDPKRNLETKRVEAKGTAQERTITTLWHPVYRLPAQVSAPLLKTSYTYDAKGNLTNKTEQPTTDANGSAGANAAASGSQRNWQYAYNEYGQLLSATGPRTDIVDKTTYTYEVGMRGNLTSVTNAVGHVTSMSNYDANGRVGQITDPNGLVTTLTYTERGWLSKLESTGEGITQTTSYEYDSVGQMIKVTLPDNSSLSYTYDNAHRLTKINDSLGNSISYTLDDMGNRTNETVTDSSGNLARQINRVYDALNRLQTVTGAAQ